MNKLGLLGLALIITIVISLLVGCDQLDPRVGNGVIYGRVYFDQNISENCEDCECGIEEIQVRLFWDSCGGEELEAVMTDSDGFFRFGDLAAGSYCVHSDLSTSCDGYLPTTPISQSVELGVDEELELEGFGYGLYVDVNE
jgi:hypothetical protein